MVVLLDRIIGDDKQYASVGLRILKDLPAECRDICRTYRSKGDAVNSIAWAEGRDLVSIDRGTISITPQGRSLISHKLVGMRFGNFTVLARCITNDRWSRPVMICQCDCGEIKGVRADNLCANIIRSCGCQKSRFISAKNLVHGRRSKDKRISKAGDHSASPEYIVWCKLRSAERGHNVMISKRWSTFQQFYLDMGERPAGYHLDREIDGRPWGPWNVRWSNGPIGHRSSLRLSLKRSMVWAENNEF